MKVVILCGGFGMRLREETEVKPKPMVEVGGMPILWHIMKNYAFHGFNDFVLCLGYKGNVIKEYFYNYEILSNDFTVELGTKNVEIYPRHDEHGWKITLVDTGSNAMTGARVKKVEKYIDGETFMLTYGDAVTDLNIKDLVGYHRAHGKIGTVTGVCPPSRYGELTMNNDSVISFKEKPELDTSLINGGYFILNKKFFNYLSDDDDCILERTPLERLASEGQLKVFHHKGFWQCMDTYRDYNYLNQMWKEKKYPWKTW